MQQIIEVIRQAIGTIPYEQLLQEFMLYSTKQPWFFTEFSRTTGILGLGMENKSGNSELPAADEKKRILDLFKN